MRHLLLVSLVLCACSTPAPAPPPAPVPAPAPVPPPTPVPPPAAQVCCESFGFGARMVKCCESYAWTAPEACTVPPDFVGGGKAVVADSMCAGVK